MPVFCDAVEACFTELANFYQFCNPHLHKTALKCAQRWTNEIVKKLDKEGSLSSPNTQTARADNKRSHSATTAGGSVPKKPKR